MLTDYENRAIIGPLTARRRGDLMTRRRAAQARLAGANKRFAEARALAPTGDADARQRAQEALIEARLAREELAALGGDGREALRRTRGMTS